MRDVLATLYSLFALAAGARSGVQIATAVERAPLAYALSALAAIVYLVLALAIARRTAAARRLAIAACSIELAGVLVVGALSLAEPGLFDDETVWSGFGQGYGYVPLVLPILGLGWLLAARSRSSRARSACASA